MEHRPLGRTGVSVSKLCLGAMMFGAWGNPDHDESIRIIHARARRRDQLRRHRRRLLAGRVGGDRRQGARRRRATTSCSPPRSTGRWARTPTGAATRAAGSSARSRTRCAGSTPTGSTSTRSTAPTRHRHRGDARRAHRPGRAGQGPLRRHLDLPAVGRSSRRSGSRATGSLAAVRQPSSRRTRSSSAASRPTCCRPAPRYGMGVIPWSPLAGGWLSGRWRKGRRARRASTRAERLPQRYDLSLPANQRKLDAAEQLALLAEEAGIPLIQTGASPSCSTTRP